MKNELELINDLLEQIYQEIKDDIRNEKDMFYNAYVFKQPPRTPLLPNIQIKSTAIPYDETLSKSETKWSLMVHVNIFAQDVGNVNGRIVAEELQEKIFDFYYHEKGFDCTFNDEIPNLDANVHRIMIRFKARYDTSTNILYRK